jgi:hypothetical protein
VTKSQVRDQGAIAVEVLSLEIFKEATTTPHHLQQATPAVMVVLVGVEMATQVVDARGKERDLHRRAADITIVQLMLLDHFGLIETHSWPPQESALQGKLRDWCP